MLKRLQDMQGQLNQIMSIQNQLDQVKYRLDLIDGHAEKEEARKQKAQEKREARELPA